MTKNNLENSFINKVNNITNVGLEWHKSAILNNAISNVEYIKESIRSLKKLSDKKKKSAFVINAGPSLHKLDIIDKIKKSDFKGAVTVIYREGWE